MITTERHVRPLQGALDAVVRKAAESYPLDESAELHGHALLQAREDWAAMRSKQGDTVRAQMVWTWSGTRPRRNYPCRPTSGA